MCSFPHVLMSMLELIAWVLHFLPLGDDVEMDRI